MLINTRRIVIIIPTYNEAESIEKTIRQLEAVIKNGVAYEVLLLIFDSQSQDTTVEIIKNLQKEFSNIVLRSEAQKTGLGNAYVQAMHYACEHLAAEIVFEYDADGSHQPQYIVPMIEALENGADVAVGSRYVAGGKCDVAWPWYRRWISRSGNWVSRLVLTKRYRDFTSGFRATRASLLAKILQQPLLSKHYAYKLHLLWELHLAQAKIVEVPIVFIDRQKGNSKLPKNSILESLSVILILRWRVIMQFCKK